MVVQKAKNLQGQWTRKATARTVTQSPSSHFKSSVCQVSSRTGAKTCHLLVCRVQCHSAPCYWHVVCDLEKMNAIWPDILEKTPPTDFSELCGLTAQTASKLYNHHFFPIQDFIKHSSCGSQLSTMYFIFKKASFLIPRSAAVLSLRQETELTSSVTLPRQKLVRDLG